MPEPDPEDLLSYAEIAEYAAAHPTKPAKVTPSSLRAYRATNRMPEPDDTRYPRVPRWKRSTIDTWLDSRVGQGKGGGPKKKTGG